MAQNAPDDGRIGKEIDWSLVVTSITRAVWEPPALEVLDLFDDDDTSPLLNINQYENKAGIPDHLRLRIVDICCEVAPLAAYWD